VFVVSRPDHGLCCRFSVVSRPDVRRLRRWWLAVLLILLLPSLSTRAADTPLTIVVSMQPLARVVHSVVPVGAAGVVSLLERGVTPHDASLRPSQVKTLLEADLVYWWGPEVEPYLVPWIRKRAAPSRDLSRLERIETLPLRAHDSHDHDGHHHAVATFDIHLWWSRHNMSLAAAAIQQDIAAQRPALAPALEALALTNRGHWEALAAEAQALGARHPRYVVFHDGWQYLEHDIGVDPEAHLISHDELGSGVKRLLTLKKRFASGAPACALVEPGMNTDLVEKLLPGARRLSLDPLGWDAPTQGVFAMFSHAYGALAECAER
jgi:zinc transport system substrate-binding protein